MNVFADKLFNILDNSIPSPPVSPLASPMVIVSTQPYTNHLIKDPYTIEPGNLVSYNMGRGSTKREVVARVISVSDSRKSIRTEDGSIVGGEFIPSGIRISGNPTVVLIQDTKLFKVIVNTKYVAAIKTKKHLLTGSKNPCNFSVATATALTQMKNIVIPHLRANGYILDEHLYKSRTSYDYLKIQAPSSTSSVCILEYGLHTTSKSWKIGTIRVMGANEQKIKKYVNIKVRGQSEYFCYYGANIEKTIKMIKDLLG